MTEPVPAPLGETELVVGLVGALGTDLEAVTTQVRTTLSDVFGYTSDAVGLSSLMSELSWDRDLSSDKLDVHIEVNMDAGRDLNVAWHGQWERDDALARLAILKIASLRQRKQPDTPDEPVPRHAYILRSLKRPDEVTLLRAVYGERFILLAAYSPRVAREKWLKERIAQDYISTDPERWGPGKALDALIRRDERESGDAGQNVRDTFHRADFFVESRDDRQPAQLERCLRVLFGDPFVTPTKDEAGMAHADAAARRSAELGRQVAAAITNDRGDVLAVGCNEVPRAHGGQYWEDDPEILDANGRPDAQKDGREYHRGIDTNNSRQQEIAADIADRLHAKGMAQDVAPDAMVEAILDSPLSDITEFGRAVHAEMAAITTAARLGVNIAGTSLFTTTFPCHNCARHIVTTGIRRLVYIAPYAKSQALRLHEDSIVVAPATEPDDKVSLVPFVGISPRRFQHLFDAPPRKDSDGTVLEYEPRTATPRLRDANAPELALPEFTYLIRETVVRHQVNEFLKTSNPTLVASPKEESK